MLDGDGCRGQTSTLSHNVDQQDKYARSRSRLQRYSLLWLLCLALTCLATVTQAQALRRRAPGRGPWAPELPTLEDQPSKPQSSDSTLLPPCHPGEPQQLPQQVRILCARSGRRQYRPSDGRSEVTQRYVNRELATEDLEELRLELTRLYIDAGYQLGSLYP